MRGLEREPQEQKAVQVVEIFSPLLSPFGAGQTAMITAAETIGSYPRWGICLLLSTFNSMWTQGH